jgi:hypothetical protein
LSLIRFSLFHFWNAGKMWEVFPAFFTPCELSGSGPTWTTQT